MDSLKSITYLFFKKKFPYDENVILLYFLCLIKEEIIDSNKEATHVIRVLENKGERKNQKSIYQLAQYFPYLRKFSSKELLFIIQKLTPLVSRNEYSKNFSALFETAFEQITRTPSYKKGAFILHPNLLRLIFKISEISTPDKVFNPFAGHAELPVILRDETSYYGQEYDINIKRIGQLRLWAHSKNSSFLLKNEDSLNNWPVKEKYDLICARLPFIRQFDLKDENNKVVSLGQFIMRNTMESLHENGKGVFILFPGILSSSLRNDIEIRRHLVDSNYLEKVIMLPHGTYRSTMMSSAVLILNKNKKNSEISFYQLDSIVNDIPKDRGSIDWNKMSVSRIENAEPDQAVVSNEEVIKNNYELDPGPYIWKAQNMRVFDTSLSNLVDILKRELANDQKIPELFISARDLVSNGLLEELKPRNINELKNIETYRVIKEPGILISRIGSKLMPTYYNGERPILIPPQVLLLRIKDQRKIDYEFLTYILNSESVEKQLKALSTGTVMQVLRPKDLERILIQLPSKKEQNKILSSYYFKTAQQLQESYTFLNRFLMERKEKSDLETNALLRHKLAGPLSNLRFYADNIKAILSSRVKSSVPDVFSLKKDESQILNLGELVEHLIRDVNKVTEEIKSQTKDINVDDYENEIIDFKKWFASFMSKIIDKNPQIEYRLNWLDMIDGDSELEKFYSIRNNKDLLSIVFDNILENIYKHAFTKDFDGKKVIDIEMKIERDDLEDQLSLVVYVSNTGVGLPVGFSEEDYKRKGVAKGDRAGTGIGGYYIHTIMDYFEGDVKVVDERMNKTKGELVTTVALRFPLIMNGVEN